jgi:hypothetical protein
MLIGIYSHIGEYLPSYNEIVVAGGDLGGSNGPYVLSTQIYNLTTNQWSLGDSLLVTVADGNHHVDKIKGDKIVVPSGRSGPNTETLMVQEYDPATGKWSNPGNLLRPHFHCYSILVGDDSILTIGGATDPAYTQDIISYTDWYDCSNNTAWKGPDMIDPRHVYSSINALFPIKGTCDDSDAIYVFGGETTGKVQFNKCERLVLGIKLDSTASPSLLSLSQTTQSVLDTACGKAKDTAFHLGGTGCPGVTLDSAYFTGSSAFGIGDTRGTPRTLDSLDSVRIVFNPTTTGGDTSYLHIKYDLGSGSRDTVITIIGSSTHAPGTLTLSQTVQSVLDMNCAPKDTSFHLGGTGCNGVTLEGASITGSSAFRIGDTRGTPRALDSLDSVRIVFTPTPPGTDTSYLHLQYNLGSGSRDTVVTLVGSSRNAPTTFSLSPTTESLFDTICNARDTSYKFGGTGCPGVLLDKMFLTGSSAFQIEDARSMPRTLDSLDSVRIVYTPAPPGVDTTYLHLVYNTGSGDRDTVITLIGAIDPSLRKVFLETLSSPQVVLATCVPLSIPIPLWINGCIANGGQLDSAYLTGSSAISISDARRSPRSLSSFDSVQLQYLPGVTAPDTAVLHLRYDLGSGTVDTTITVIGTVMNPLPPPAILLPSTIQSILSTSCAGSDTGLRIGVTGCPLQNGTLDSVWLTGSPTLQISDTRSVPRSLLISDSIGILYSPNGGGSDTSELHIRYDVGAGPQDTVLTVIGSVASPLLAQPAHMRRESSSAYYDGLDSLPLQLDISTSVNFDSLWNLVTEIQGTCAFDPSVVSAVQYLPPSPWTLVSFTAHASSFDFEIINKTGRAQNPLDLGTALFRPKSSEPATSWVTMPRLLLTIGNQTNSLCVIDNEDNHWAVKTLGLTASVASPTLPTAKDEFVLYPNPAEDEFFVRSEADQQATITIYDAIGRIVGTASVAAQATAAIDTHSLTSGVYFVRIACSGVIDSKMFVKE